MTETWIENLTDELIANNTIPSDYYDKFDVKRGLRNQDGSGVLAGLTKVSSVVGTEKTDIGLSPIEGVLKYRGKSLSAILDSCKEDERYHFERICFFLLVGRMPNKEEVVSVCDFMSEHRTLPTELIENVIKGIPSKNIMNKLQTSIAALYAFDENPDSLDPKESFRKSLKLIAKLPLIVAYSYLAAFKGNPTYVKPEKNMSLAESFLYILYEGKMPSPFEAYVVDLAMILHAEHGGGNNSTFTTYVVTSSASDIYSTMAASIASLKGPLHGAANKKVMEMMALIKGHVKNWEDITELKEFLAKLVNKEAGDKSGKIYGLGHAVYTKSDPRATAIKVIALRIAKETGREAEYALYNAVAEHGPDVFLSLKKSDKVIAPNVDFYSGFVYDCLNIPQEIYTPIFAMARCCGWCAHRIEETLSGKRIIRPGYKYIAS
jgi:citrate synthase